MLIGQIIFKEKESENVFKSFTKQEIKELQEDFQSLLIKLKAETRKANFYEGKIQFNQRFTSNKYVSGVLCFDITPNQNPFIYFEVLRELEIDEYLDSINSQKNLSKEWKSLS